ncbi:hypothetical protein [Vibrio tetraodonis]|uniref:hypothetical protein n=1 Tax=Vibrio tetraodonis TaxID=2231647 RepID=UPI000E0B7D36|nr:hypothetical protein [Vibrio tetraodonis]
MKLTKLSVLFSSLYFGLVGNGYSSNTATMTFTETIDLVCGLDVKVPSGGNPTILFKGEQASSGERFVTFTPFSNNSTKQALQLAITTLTPTNLDFVSTEGEVTSIGNDLKLWIGPEGRKTSASYDDVTHAKLATETYTVSHAEPLSAIATVNRYKSEIARRASGNAEVEAVITLTCRP